jgi:hypothetical protein
MNIKGLHPSLIQFREDNLPLEVSFDVFRGTFSNSRSIHNGTYANLFIYHRLQQFIDNDKAVFYPGAAWLLNNQKHKIFSNDDEQFISKMNFTSIDPIVYKKFVVYSTHQQRDILRGMVESKQNEIMYDLNDIFDFEVWKQYYSDLPAKKVKKKFYNRVVAPFKALDSQFVVKDVEENDLPLIKQIHDEWVAVKWEDPRTFRHNFSTNRYYRTIIMMYESPNVNRSAFYAKIFFWQGKPIGVRQILIEDQHGYDISFLTRYWEVPSQLVNQINVWCMRDLVDKGIYTLNVGLPASTGLKNSKQHFPHSHLTSFKYNLKLIA